jgi:hypothetical protein
LGDNYLAGQRSHRQRGREQATVILSRPTLFSRAEIVNTSYPISPKDESITFREGEVLRAYVDQADRSVIFSRGECKVGSSSGDAAAALLQAMVETGEEGFCVEVTQVRPISGVAEARIMRSDANEQPHRASA